MTNLSTNPDISEICLATTNRGKQGEFQDFLVDLPIALCTLSQPLPEDIETGSSFLENATLKATAAAQAEQKFCLADDSGLCIPALGEEPGIHSARYFEDGQGIQKILGRMAEEQNRQAYFVCALVLVSPEAKVIWQTEQRWLGTIAQQACGTQGFGYDPIFQPQGYQETAGELSPKQKNRLSHRARAVAELKHFLYAQQALLPSTMHL